MPPDPLPDMPELPVPLTLCLFRGERLLFSSQGRWLHPLFELEEHLEAGGNPAGTRLLDRVTGRGAALLVVRLGIPELHTGILSRRAIPVLERWRVRYTGAQVVDRIACATEDLLAGLEDPEAARTLLLERRNRALGR